MTGRLRASQEWQFFAALPKAAPGLTAAWWLLLVLRGTLPVAFGVAMGVLVGAIAGGRDPLTPLLVASASFIALQTLAPLHTAVGANLGDRTAAWLYDRLTIACVKPPGLAHLEQPALAQDLTVARDFDLGMTGPPLFIAMDFIAGGLVKTLAGLCSAAVLAAYAWWAALLLVVTWAATQWLLRESAVWYDRNTETVRAAQQEADYAYRLAVEAAPAKELRLFGLADWVLDRFITRRTRLHALQHEATRLRERSLAASLLLVGAAGALVSWWLAGSAIDGRMALGAVIVAANAAFGVSNIAFGGLNWALDGAAAPVSAVARLEAAMALAGTLPAGSLAPPAQRPPDIRFRQVSFAYPGSAPVLDGVDLTVPAGTSLAIVGVNGAGKTTLAKLLCRFYDPQSGAIEIDGVDLRQLAIEGWRRRITAVFQDFLRLERPLRENVAPNGAPDDDIRQALADAGAAQLTSLDTILARGYDNGTDLSGGQWQRVALARSMCAVRLGAGVVLLDEPTAQLDVRGESEIFNRLLAATRHCTTILISHRFSTVRQADRICVLEHGRVTELGTHEELMARHGRYRTMFDLQAQHFTDGGGDEGTTYEPLV